jgi:hypothetical protein
MKPKQQIIVICLIAISILISGCGPGQLFGPKITPTPTLTLTAIPTPTPTTIPTITPDPSEGTVRGTILNGANILIAIFPQVNESFTLEMSNNIPQVQTDQNGHFEFLNVEPGLYLLASPQNDGSFKTYSEPSNSNLIASRIAFGNFWTFEVKAGQSIDLGNLN